MAAFSPMYSFIQRVGDQPVERRDVARFDDIMQEVVDRVRLASIRVPCHRDFLAVVLSR